MIEFKWYEFSQLPLDLLYQLLQLRSEVFVVEQNCVYLDADGNDYDALHLLGFENNKVVAYCRLMNMNALNKPLVFGRVVTAFSVRHKGYGKALLKTFFNYCASNFPLRQIHCSAQAHLINFYQAFGLKPSGEIYLEDGIPHIAMSSSL